MIRINLDRLGKAIVDYKDRVDCTYAFLGREVGITDSTLCRIANGQLGDVSIDTVSRIADYIKVDPLHFFITTDDYVNLSRLPEGKRQAVEAILSTKAETV